jgi:hypothetical protein
MASRAALKSGAASLKENNFMMTPLVGFVRGENQPALKTMAMGGASHEHVRWWALGVRYPMNMRAPARYRLRSSGYA